MIAYRLVPVEPTEEMLAAGEAASFGSIAWDTAEWVYEAMITAAPEADVARLVEALEEARLTIEVLQGRGNSAGVTLSIIDRALAPYRKGGEA